MKKILLIIILLAVSFLGTGCSNNKIWRGEDFYTQKAIFDNSDYWLLEVVERKNESDGYYLYKLKEYDDTYIPNEWFRSDKLFSVGELILGIEYTDKDGVEGLLFYDID